MQEQQQAEQKKRDEAEDAGRLAQYCQDLRTEFRTLSSGVRIARVNEQGEREFMSDEERARREESVRRDLQSRCANSD
jgi:hypothetical protein